MRFLLAIEESSATDFLSQMKLHGLAASKISTHPLALTYPLALDSALPLASLVDPLFGAWIVSPPVEAKKAQDLHRERNVLLFFEYLSLFLQEPVMRLVSMSLTR
jgi:hypothetical protein